MIKIFTALLGLTISVSSQASSGVLAPKYFFAADQLVWNPNVQQTVVGIINRASDGSLSINPIGSATYVPLSPGNQVAANQMRGLQNFDLLQGAASRSNSGFLLSDIDFVGLNRLLGRWYASDSSTYQFKDFSYLSITGNASFTGPISYAISPESDGSFKLFIAITGQQVVLYSLTFLDDNHIVMTSEDNGQQSLTLSKINP